MNRARIQSAVAGTPPAAEKVIERNGLVYRRAVNLSSDTTFVDPSIVPEGMVYQWNRVSTYNMEDSQNMVANARAGWTPVPAARHDGMFMPVGHKGNILNEGLRLEERPIEWHREAIAEEDRKARAQMNESRRQWGMETTSQADFSTTTPRARQATFANTVIEPINDIPRPNLSEIPIDD